MSAGTRHARRTVLVADANADECVNQLRSAVTASPPRSQAAIEPAGLTTQ